MPMTAPEYLTIRQHLGTQQGVAALLGVARSTVERREKGKMPITHEAELAILALGKPKRRDIPSELQVP